MVYLEILFNFKHTKNQDEGGNLMYNKQGIPGKSDLSKEKPIVNEQSAQKGLTLRVIIISSIWVIFIGWLNMKAEILQVIKPISYEYAPSAPGIFAILLILLFNFIVVKFVNGRFKLSRQEMMMVYIMTMVGTILISSGMMYLVPSAMMHINIPLSGATSVPADRWEPYVDYFTRLGTPMNEDSAKAYWLGLGRSGLDGIPWGEWIRMAPLWLVFLGSIYLMLLGLSTLIRYRWTEVEHLTFPLAEPVVTLIDLKLHLPGGTYVSIFKNNLLWIGFLLGGFIPLWNWLCTFIPAVPVIVTSYPIERIFREYPNSAWYALSRPAWPAVTAGAELIPILVGACYFAPTGVLNSIVFSATLLFIPIKMLGYTLGISRIRGVYQYAFQFNVGAYIAITISSLWLLRNQIKVMWKEAFSEKKEKKSNELFSYKAAFLFVIGGAIVFLFFVMFFFQQPVRAALFMLLIIIGCSVGFARGRAMVGHPSYPELLAHTVMRDGLGGTPGMGIKGMFGAAYYRMFDKGAHFMPVGWTLESCQLADRVKLRRSDVGWGMLIIFAVSFVAGLLILVPPAYEYGAATFPTWPGLFWNGYSYDSFHYPYVAEILEGKTYGVLISTGVGALFAAFFTFMQLKFVWWPLDPIGFAIGHTRLWIGGAWVNALIALLVKNLALRWGGQSLYTKLKPLFLGIILGAAMTQTITNVISMLMQAFS